MDVTLMQLAHYVVVVVLVVVVVEGQASNVSVCSDATKHAAFEKKKQKKSK